jgi:glycosyltransferase involved in cell wall biosynthesis
LRVAVVSNLFPPHAYGGYELTCADVAERLQRRGHAVTVLTSDHRRRDITDGFANGPRSPALDVQRRLPLTWGHGRRPAPWRRIGLERRAHARTREFLGAAAPDAVLVWNLAGLPLSLVHDLAGAGRPLVYVLADAWPAQAWEADPWVGAARRHPLAGRLAALAARVPTRAPALGSTGTFCFCSASLRDACARGPGGPFPDTEIAWLGRNADDFPLAEAHDLRSERGAWSWRLLFVGRMDAAKGVDTLVRALTELPDAATLNIVGPPEPVHVDRLRALVERSGLGTRVHIESMDRAALRRAYETADVCVFPSEWDEPFGIVPLESMACATPVVATGTGGSGEYLADGRNCVLFDAGDAHALAAAVTRVARDDGLRARIVAGGRATTDALTTDRLTDQLESVLERAVTARR